MKTETLGAHMGTWVKARTLSKMGFRVVEEPDGEPTLRDLDPDEYLWEGMVLEHKGERYELFLYNPKRREFFVESRHT